MAFNFYDEIDKRYELFESGQYDELFAGIKENYYDLKRVFEVIFYNKITVSERARFACVALQSEMDNSFKIMVFNNLSDEAKMDVFKMLLLDNKNVKIPFNDLDINFDHKNFIVNNITKFADIGFNLYNLEEMAAGNNTIISEIDNYYNNHKDRVDDILVNNIDEDTLSTYGDIIRLMVLDIMKNENASFSDVKWAANEGFHSMVLFIKEKVLKIGFGRSTKTFPNNPYIVKPLLRRSFDINNKKLFVEVTEKVLSGDECKNITYEELYGLYKHLRQLGLVWTDVGVRNVGRLTKDNIIHWNGNLNPTDDILELEQYVGEGIELKAGDLVVLDADYIYHEDDPILLDFVHDYDFDDGEPDYNFEAFEERYQNELKQKTR